LTHIVDSHLSGSLNKHISSICKSAYYHIWSLRHIRLVITDDMAKRVACLLTLLPSRLCQLTSLQYYTKNINWLQCVQNTLAELLPNTLLHMTCSSGINK